MEKLNRYFPAALFLASFCKVSIVGVTFADAAVMAILALWAVSIEFKLQSSDKTEVLAAVAEIKKDVKDIDTKVQVTRSEMSAFKMMRK